MKNVLGFSAEDALAKMWVLADKPERLRCFHKIVTEIGIADPKLFWGEFWHIWQSSESLFLDLSQIIDLIEIGQKLGSPRLGLDEDEIAALEKMPDMVTIYRGSIEGNEDGWSWTTDMEKARWFANRSYGSRQRVVTAAMVNKDQIIGYLTDRGESEIVVRPEDLDSWLEEEWEAENNGPAFFHAIQTGAYGAWVSVAEKSAALTARSIQSEAFDQAKEQIKEQLPFAEWAGLARGKYMAALLREIERREREG